METTYPDTIARARRSDCESEKIEVTASTIIIKNDFTTKGYATFDAELALLTYIFVSPMFRRRGVGTHLVRLAETACGRSLAPASPISRLGQKFFEGIRPDA